jgi:alpha-L-arabinofuranosidase
VKVEVASPAGALDATALRSEDGRSLVLEVTNIGDLPARTTVRLEGFEPKGATARLTELSGELTGVNTPQDPERIAPRERVIPFDPAGCLLDLPARSFTVVRIE